MDEFAPSISSFLSIIISSGNLPLRFPTWVKSLFSDKTYSHFAIAQTFSDLTLRWLMTIFALALIEQITPSNINISEYYVYDSEVIEGRHIQHKCY